MDNKPLLLFYGNCQTHAIMQIMTPSLQNYHIRVVPCFLPDIIEKYEFTDLIERASVIITQPIKKGYRNLDYLDTQYIIDHASENARICIFPSIHFSFYHFDTVHGPPFPNGVVYHYKTLRQFHSESRHPSEFISDVLNNPGFRSESELQEIAVSSLAELSERENAMQQEYEHIPSVISCITVSDFIALNYQKEILMFTINHPGKSILQYISKTILMKLQLPVGIDTDIDPLYHSDRCMVYKCVQQFVNNDVYTPSLVRMGIQGDSEMVHAYYNLYDQYVID